jgi:MtN3 and saliva related transmembrane protein
MMTQIFSIFPEHFMTFADAIGFLAASMTTCAFVPQVVHSYRTRDVSGISLVMYLVFTIGVALWLAYGIITRAWPVIIANALTLALAAAILFLKLGASSPAKDGGKT